MCYIASIFTSEHGSLESVLFICTYQLLIRVGEKIKECIASSYWKNMVDIQKYNITNDTAGLDAISSTIKPNVTEDFNCSVCTNELCFEDLNYQLYEEWISVNNFETVLIILHTIQILTGILGNLLVSRCQFFYLICLELLVTCL